MKRPPSNLLALPTVRRVVGPRKNYVNVIRRFRKWLPKGWLVEVYRRV